jgi:hypothetical protein
MQRPLCQPIEASTLAGANQSDSHRSGTQLTWYETHTIPHGISNL